MHIDIFGVDDWYGMIFHGVVNCYALCWVVNAQVVCCFTSNRTRSEYNDGWFGLQCSCSLQVGTDHYL